jgi:hypothetical protein
MRADEPRRDVAGLSELQGVHAGEPIAVLGAGPSLPADLERLPAGAILIGVNHHAIKIIDVDYLVFMDYPGRIPDLMAAVEAHEGRRITPMLAYTDYDISTVKFWDGGFTAAFATWIACFLGGDPVLLCGMDCFTGDNCYFYESEFPKHPSYHYSLDKHLGAWRKALDRCERPEVIRAVSGPLVDVFGGVD